MRTHQSFKRRLALIAQVPAKQIRIQTHLIKPGLRSENRLKRSHIMSG